MKLLIWKVYIGWNDNIKAALTGMGIGQNELFILKNIDFRLHIKLLLKITFKNSKYILRFYF